MKILFRKDQGENWQYLNHKKYSDEGKLQGMLFKDPKIIPIEDIFPDSKNNIILVLREVGLPGSGSIDLLGIDNNGNIYIIETKLASNSEVKREVIGQVLEYAAFLEEQEINWLDDITKKQTNRSIEQNFEHVANWSKKNFLQSLQDNLVGGRFWESEWSRKNEYNERSP